MKLGEVRAALGDTRTLHDASFHAPVLAWFVSDAGLNAGEAALLIRHDNGVLGCRWAVASRGGERVIQQLTALLPGLYRPWTLTTWTAHARKEFP